MKGQLAELIRHKIVDAQAGDPPAFTRRDTRFPTVHGKAVALIGMRRSGKTTLLWQILSDRVAAGVPRAGLLYFNFEDERLAGLTAADLSILVEEFYRINPDWRDRRRAVFLLDEIQVVSGWERFARRLLDTERLELFVSGSSAKLLSREIATSMRGRALEATVFPFSFREYLRHHEREPSVPLDRVTKAARSVLQKDLRTYLIAGGFPEAQGVAARDRLELLKSYVDVALLRDVIERHAVSHPVALRWMSRQLLANAGGHFSVNRFYNDLKAQGIPVAKDTLYAYLGYLEDAFLIHTIPVATMSERRRMVNPRKAFPADPGLIALYDRSGRTNLGHRLETIVLLALLRRGAEVSYVRTEGDHEVDFLARFPDGSEILVQVCAETDDPATREREARALMAARAEHPRAERHFVTLTPETARDLPGGVVVHAAEMWLLAQDPL